MTQEIKLYEGVVANVKTTKKDGSLLMTGKGAPFVVAGFKNADGSWLNLTAFDAAHHPMLQPGNQVKVGYTEEVQTDGFGEPKMYNGVAQYYRNVTAVQVMGEQAAPATQSQNAASPAPQRGNIPAEVSVRQTAANGATNIVGAMLGAEGWTSANDQTIMGEWDHWAGHILAWITGQPEKNEFDAFMDKAKADMGAKEETEEFGF